MFHESTSFGCTAGRDGDFISTKYETYIVLNNDELHRSKIFDANKPNCLSEKFI